MAKMPRRRKSSDNPYELISIESKQIIKFKDNKGNIQEIVVSNELFNIFDKFELEDLSQLNKYDRHIEHLELTDEVLYSRAIQKKYSIDEIVEKNIFNEKLKNAIKELPDIQRNRIIKYFFDGKTYEEIAKEESCTKRAVKFSIDIALEKISKKLQK